MIQEIPPTICRDCVFAKYDKRGVQTDCNFHNRLWNLRDNGASLSIVEEVDRTYYKIENRLCSAVRNHNWGATIPKKDWKRTVEEKIALRLTYVIVVGRDNVLEDVIETVNQAEDQNPKPFSILVVIDPAHTPTSFDSFDVVDYLKNRPLRYWSVERLPVEKALKVTKQLGVHFTIFFAGADIPTDFSERLNILLNYEMKRFIVIQPDDDGNGGVMQTGAPLNQIENLESLVKTWETVYE